MSDLGWNPLHGVPSYPAERYAVLADRIGGILRSRSDIVLVQAEAVVALEAGAVSLARPGLSALNLVTSPYGDWFGQWLRRGGAIVRNLVAEPGLPVEIDAVAKALDAGPHIDVLAVVHAESASGILNPLPEILTLARARGIVTVVDAVASVGGHQLEGRRSWHRHRGDRSAEGARWSGGGLCALHQSACLGSHSKGRRPARFDPVAGRSEAMDRRRPARPAGNAGAAGILCAGGRARPHRGRGAGECHCPPCPGGIGDPGRACRTRRRKLGAGGKGFEPGDGGTDAGGAGAGRAYRIRRAPGGRTGRRHRGRRPSPTAESHGSACRIPDGAVERRRLRRSPQACRPCREYRRRCRGDSCSLQSLKPIFGS
ncbi:putative aspartate aminotransferase (plasmid) [Rhizobium phaseoli Ch24-10]|nr:putative aspartate aminotransferase [Rhizobium phaseoli Ch24-10]